MPGLDVGGSPDKAEWGDYYCDSHDMEGESCPEFDLMQANTHFWRSTVHGCDHPNRHGHYRFCDKWGTFTDPHFVDPLAYGRGREFDINTEAPFHVKMSFDIPYSYTVEMTQFDK